MYGGKTISSDSMNAHKAMAGAGDKGNFGVGKLPQRDAPSADLGMKHTAMDDSARGAPAPIKSTVNGHGGLSQAAPDHGSMGKDHFMRDGKA